MSHFAIVKAETKFCHRYPVEHNEYLFVEVKERESSLDGPYLADNYIKLYKEISETYGKKPTILIVRPLPKAKWWQFWRWF